MTGRTIRRRFPITAITVVGLGALVALAVGVSLYLGLSSATENTRPAHGAALRMARRRSGAEDRVAASTRDAAGAVGQWSRSSAGT